MTDPERARRRMIDRQLAARDIHDPRVLDAMGEVPRERFVSPRLAEFAYEDEPLPIEAGQTISQPYIVAYMLQAADIREGDKVLEIGAGSGYAAAVMSRLGREVHAVERHPELVALARIRLRDLGYLNVQVHEANGSVGWPEAAPYDVIVVSAGGPMVPPALKRQLAPQGRLVMPVGGSPRRQQLCKLTRTGEGEHDDAFAEQRLEGVAFVPLIGAQGWHEGSDPASTSRH